MDPTGEAQSAGKTFDELRFARAQIAGQGDKQAVLRGATPGFAERCGFGSGYAKCW